MNKNTSLIVLIAGIIVALLAGVGTFVWLQKRTVIRPEKLSTQTVVIAAADLSRGRVLDASLVKTVDFLKASLPQGSFSRTAELEGRTLLYPVRAGEPLFESQLAPASVKAGGMSAIISPNKRAMAVRVDNVSGVSGFINPGNRVDVIVTAEGFTKTVLENVLVLTIGQEIEKTGKQKEKATPVDVITLEVTSDEAEKLAMAATAGRVMLVLRNPTDADAVTTKGVTMSGLLSSRSAPVAARSASVVGTARPTFVVQGIRGGAVSEQNFYGEGK